MASPSINISTETLTLATSQVSSIFFPYDGSRVAKIKKYLINFIRAYKGDYRKIILKHKLKSILFNWRPTNHIRKKSFIFNSLQVKESSYKFLFLDAVK